MADLLSPLVDQRAFFITEVPKPEFSISIRSQPMILCDTDDDFTIGRCTKMNTKDHDIQHQTMR
jgi:hypothetical protein